MNPATALSRLVAVLLMATVLVAGCHSDLGVMNPQGFNAAQVELPATFATSPQFVFDGTRVSGISVSGAPILGSGVATGGVYLIGSADGSDAQGKSATSVGSSGGRMKSDDPARVPPPPFKFMCTIVNATTLHIHAEVGPVVVPFETMSMPFDFGLWSVNRFAFNGNRFLLRCTGQDGWRNGSGADYSSIHQACPITPGGVLLGYVGVASTEAPTTWGQVFGPLASVRVTITSSSHYRKMLFYNHPGTHNLELGFGRMAAGEKAVVDCDLTVTPVPAPTWTFEAERDFAHQVGRPYPAAWSASTGLDAAGYMLFGPYVTGIPAGSHNATFRAMIDVPRNDALTVVVLDVFDSSSGAVLARRAVRRSEFPSAGYRFADFTVPFNCPAALHKIECRAYFTRVSFTVIDRVVVR